MLSYCSSEKKKKKKKKKSVKQLQIAFLGLYLGKNWASMGHVQNEAQFFFRK